MDNAYRIMGEGLCLIGGTALGSWLLILLGQWLLKEKCDWVKAWEEHKKEASNGMDKR